MDEKLSSILELFSNNPDKLFYLRHISKLTGIAPATTYRLLQKLVGKEIIKQETINKFKLYVLNDNEKAKIVRDLFSKQKSALESFVSLISSVKGVELVYLVGKPTSKKANMIIIGRDIDPMRLKRIVVKIKEDFDFTIIYLTLTQEQYVQMSSMGLYPGEKKIIFRSTNI